MEEQDKKLSWPDLFLVTSACFFLFSVYLKFVEFESPGIFLWVALGCLVLGILAMAANIVIGPGENAE